MCYCERDFSGCCSVHKWLQHIQWLQVQVPTEMIFAACHHSPVSLHCLSNKGRKWPNMKIWKNWMILWYVILQWVKGATGSGWSFRTITCRSWCCLTLIRTARRCVARGLQRLAMSQVCDKGTHTHKRTHVLSLFTFTFSFADSLSLSYTQAYLSPLRRTVRCCS